MQVAGESAHSYVTKSLLPPATLPSSNGNASRPKIPSVLLCTRQILADDPVSSPQAEAYACSSSRVTSGDTTYVQAGIQSSAIVEQMPSFHCTELARDCFLDPDIQLPPTLQEEWDSKIVTPLCDAINQSLPDADFTLECVMARSSKRGSSKPTVLLMCSDDRHKQQLKTILRNCRYISGRNFERKVIILGNEVCVSGDDLSASDTLSGEKAVVETATSNASTRPVLFASLAKMYFEKDAKSTAIATIGGVLSIAGVLYGLTTAHGIRTMGSRQQDSPELSDTAAIGYVECFSWAPENEKDRLNLDRSSQVVSDWALVRLRTEAITSYAYNEIMSPKTPSPQSLNGYIKREDLASGEVTIYAGVSGVQRAFLSGASAYVGMAGSVFQVRSMSLERPLVNGDSGSWVLRDDKLCGYIFSRLGKGVTWGYMLPIEPVFDAIAQYWLQNYGTTCYPGVALKAREAAIAPAPGPLILRSGHSIGRNTIGYRPEIVAAGAGFGVVADHLLENHGTTSYPGVALGSEEAAIGPPPAGQLIHSSGFSPKTGTPRYRSSNVASQIPTQRPMRTVSVGGETVLPQSQSKECDRLTSLLKSSDFFTAFSAERSIRGGPLLYDAMERNHYRMVLGENGRGVREYLDLHRDVRPNIVQASVHQAPLTSQTIRPQVDPNTPGMSISSQGMVSSEQSYPRNYWTWHSGRQDDYHAEVAQGGTWSRPWLSSLNSPSVHQSVNSPVSSIPRTQFVNQPGGQAPPPLGSPRPNFHAYPTPLAASAAHSHSTTSGAAPGAYPSQTARTVEITSPPIFPSGYSQGAVTGIAQAPTQYRPANQVTSGAGRHTSSVAGKKRAPPHSSNALSLSEDEEDHTDQALSKAMENSRIMYAQEKHGGGASYPQAGGPTHPMVKPSSAASIPVSLLDPKDFKFIAYKAHKFFVVGKVFMIFHIENAGANSEAYQLAGPSFTTVAHGEHAHHQFRRFVVVKDMSKEHYCYCCPITTYGGRGAAKPGVDQTVHTIAYTGDLIPAKLPGETNMRKDPIRIVPVSLAEKLDPLSRINIGKIFPIEHNRRVKDIGQVDEKSLPKLLGYRKMIRDGG